MPEASYRYRRNFALVIAATIIVWLTAAGGVETALTYTVRVLLIFAMLYFGIGIVRRLGRLTGLSSAGGG